MFALYALATTIIRDREVAGFPMLEASTLLGLATQLDKGLGNIHDSWSSFCFINRWNEGEDYTPAERYLVDRAVEMAHRLGS